MFRARTRPGLAEAFEERARALGFDRMSNTPGLHAWIGGKPLDDDDRDFVMVTLWEDEESLRTYAGENWKRIDLPAEERAMLESLSVEHFDVASSSLGNPGGAVVGQ